MGEWHTHKPTPAPTSRLASEPTSAPTERRYAPTDLGVSLDFAFPPTPVPTDAPSPIPMSTPRPSIARLPGPMSKPKPSSKLESGDSSHQEQTGDGQPAKFMNESL